MPKRTRSHRLEDLSIQKVEQSLPDRWVCRRKDKDYGVDLEVEIFDDRDEATGLMFYVQIKGTDNLAKADALSIKTDRLDYLSKLDSPSIIVRYCSETDSFRWMWLTNVHAQLGPISTASVTIRFDSATLWSEDDPERMVRTLQVYRAIRLAPRRLAIGLTTSSVEAEAQADFEFRCAVADVLDGSRTLITSSDPMACLPVTLSLDGDLLRLEIDVIASIGVRLRRMDRAEIAAQLAYALAYMAGGYGFLNQERDIAGLILDRDYRCQSREIAAFVASDLVEFPDLASDLASLNDLHARQDEAYARYIHAILSSTLPLDDRLGPISRFYEAALTAHAGDSVVQSSVHYSYGNALRNSQDFLGAVREYNRARKKNSDYLERPYFLRELAAACFFARRFAMASDLYAEAHRREGTAKTAICAGDARLLAGLAAEAVCYYEEAIGSTDEFESAEGALKHWLARWAIDFTARREEADEPTAAGEIPFWERVFNNAVAREDAVEALGATLMLCALKQDNSAVLWAQALGVAPFVGDQNLLAAVVNCAVWTHGYTAYSLFRDNAVGNGIPADVFEGMDRLAAELNERRRIFGREPVTTRVVGEHHWDTIVRSDTEISRST